MIAEVLVVAFLWGMVAFAVALDASRREWHSGFWAVLTVLTGVFGAVLYGIVVLTTSEQSDDEGSEDETEPETIRICPDCSSEYDDPQRYCGECGAEFGPEDEYPVGRRLETGSRRYCSNCKSEVDRTATTCHSCGAVF